MYYCFWKLRLNITKLLPSVVNVLSCAKTQSFGLQACLFLSSLCLSAVPKLGFNLRCLSAVLPVTAMSDKHHCSCCSHPVSSPSVHQTLDEMDFERGIWSAALDGDLQRVRLLVQKGTDPNMKDSAGYTALHYGSRSGHLAVCSFLLESGACPSPQTPGGATPLHRAAYCGHPDVVRLLLQSGADPTLCDDDGANPLHKAAEQGHAKVCQLLLERCPALCSQGNKKLQLPYQLTQQGDLQEILKPPRS